jgi:hypothetical protein
MMTADRLHDLFEKQPGQSQIGLEGQCHDCGKGVSVAVALAPDGFAVSGGAVYEPEPEKFFYKCPECHRREPLLKEFRRCEVYSRVVGYLRPVAQWNEGKQSEFADRKVYRLSAD